MITFIFLLCAFSFFSQESSAAEPFKEQLTDQQPLASKLNFNYTINPTHLHPIALEILNFCNTAPKLEIMIGYEGESWIKPQDNAIKGTWNKNLWLLGEFFLSYMGENKVKNSSSTNRDLEFSQDLDLIKVKTKIRAFRTQLQIKDIKDAFKPHDWVIVIWALASQYKSTHEQPRFNQSACPTPLFNEWLQLSAAPPHMQDYTPIDFVLSINALVSFKILKLISPLHYRSWLANWIFYSEHVLDQLDEYRLQNIRGCLYALPFDKDFYEGPLSRSNMNLITRWCRTWCVSINRLSKFPNLMFCDEYDPIYIQLPLIRFTCLAEEQKIKIAQITKDVQKNYPNNLEKLIQFSP